MQATEAPAPAPAPAPADPVAERAGLMGDPAFAKAAANPTSAEWQRLTEVNTKIAAAQDAATAAADAEAAKKMHLDGELQPEAVAEGDSFDPPANPDEYSLFSDFARQQGLQVDPVEERGLRVALHQAGVDQGLAVLAYSAAISAALSPTPQRYEAQQMAARSQTESALRGRWGPAYDAKVALAQDEARAIFAKLPASVTRGESFEDFVESRGLGNDQRLIERLVARAEARSAKGGK
jgi:hypothetical protein